MIIIYFIILLTPKIIHNFIKIHAICHNLIVPLTNENCFKDSFTFFENLPILVAFQFEE